MTQMRRCFGIAGAVAILLSLAPTATAQQTKSLPPETVRFFETRIRPVLAEHCFKCHGPEKQRGHLRLDSRAGIQTGGEIGSAVDDKNPEQSLILKAIRHDDPEFKMPPSSKLKREQIDDLTRWVKMGIPWPGASETAPTPAKKSDKEITAKDRQFWVFQPVKRPAVPTVKGPVANPVDHVADLEPGIDCRRFRKHLDHTRPVGVGHVQSLPAEQRAVLDLLQPGWLRNGSSRTREGRGDQGEVDLGTNRDARV